VRLTVLDAPLKMDADGVKTPKNAYQEIDRDLAEMQIIAQNGFSKPVSVLNVASIKTAHLALLTHFVVGASLPILVLNLQSIKADVH